MHIPRLKSLLYIATPFVVVVLIVIAFFLGDKHGVEHMSFKHITTTQAAQAMKNDDFYSSYRENTLMISGKVTSVSHSGRSLIVGFKTDSSYGTACSFVNYSGTIRPGETINILSEGAVAERQPSTVLLHSCQII